MKKIVEPVNLKLLLEELSSLSPLKLTSKGNNLIYSFEAQEAPSLMEEVARLRELSFRTAGGHCIFITKNIKYLMF